MFFLEVENEFGRRLQLTQNESNYQVLKVEGLLPPKADIVTIRTAMSDGEKYKSSHVDMRNIVITIKLRGNVERNRILLYEFFSVGARCRIFYRNGTRKVSIEGYTENMDGDLFANGQTVQVSIVCPDPFWNENPAKVFDLSYNRDLFEFPFSIDSVGVEFSNFNQYYEAEIQNIGDVETGVVWTVKADGGSVINPVLYNVLNQQFIKVQITLTDSTTLIVKTRRGARKAVLVDLAGNEQNALDLVATNSTWLLVPRGRNVFTINADSGKQFMKSSVEIENRYKGV